MPMTARWSAASFLTAIALLALSPIQVVAQDPAAEAAWNDPATLGLVQRAIERRAGAVVDTTLQNYSADGRGFVYFLLDAPELDRQTLVRTDQVALEVYWRAPNQIRQRIVGLREQRELPVNRLYYYLDRLTVVQDNYGSAIVIADGDNVNDVPHPVAEGGLSFYDYTIEETLTLRLPGIDRPVSVREVRVRPKDPSLPAVVGSIFLEDETAALVRMAFTFTPSAYVDPRLDYINVVLENGLWQGRFWLPHEQRLEIRRELPELDLPFGTVIRTRMRISNYQFNQALADWLFSGPHPITFLPEAQRRSFPFEEPIDAERELEGIGEPAGVDEVRREARAMLRERAISGLPRGRLGLGAISDVFRYNRAEGLARGAGIGWRPAAAATVRLHGGWAFGPGHPTARGSLAWQAGALDARLEGYGNRVGDVGGEEVTPGLLNSLSSLVLGTDWLDPFYASGATLGIERDLGAESPLRVGIEARLERQRSATRTTGYSLLGEEDSFQPVREIDDGTHASASLRVAREAPAVGSGWWGSAETGIARLATSGEDHGFGHAEGEIGFSASLRPARAVLEISASAATLFGEPPRQQLFLLGGRGSLPGYDFRSFGGTRRATVALRASTDLWNPWVRGRLFAGVGAVDASEASAPRLREWGVDPAGEARFSVGAGVGLFYDLLRVDVARGLGTGGRTQILLEANPTFIDFL